MVKNLPAMRETQVQCLVIGIKIGKFIFKKLLFMAAIM